MSPTRPSARPARQDLEMVQEVCWLSLLLAERVQASFSAHANAAGLTAIQAKVLLQLQPGDGLPMNALAKQVRSDASNLTGPVDKLEARGAIARRAGTVDRRVKTIVLTDEGRRLRDDLWHDITHDPGPIAHLAGDKVAALRDLLREAVQPAATAAEAAGRDGR